MRRLMVLPDKAGYSAALGATGRASSLQGPAAAIGRRPIGAAAAVECTWLCSPGDYQYLRAFFRTGTAVGALPFTAALAVGGAELEDHVAVFVPGSFCLKGVAGDQRTVSATLVATPSRPAAMEFDAAVALLLSEYGPHPAGALSELEELVNVALPESL